MDLKALGNFLSINDHDVVLLIHLIAKSILTCTKTIEATPEDLFTEKQSRDTWEKNFNTEYILPVIRVRIIILI